MESPLFIYSWFEDRVVKNCTILRLYGLNEENKNICLTVSSFKPWMYIEVDTTINQQTIFNFLKVILKPFQLIVTEKYKLYGFNRNKYTYFKAYFNSKQQMYSAIYNKSKIKIQGTDVYLKFHEHKTSTILQFCSEYKLPTAGWVTFDGEEFVDNNSLCDKNYKVNNITALNDYEAIIYPKVMAWDIETNSEDMTRFPDAANDNDSVFQISCIFQGPNGMFKHLLSINYPDQNLTGKDVIIHNFHSEKELLLGFVSLIRNEKPNITIGYNTFNFDIPFLLERSKKCRCESEFAIQGLTNNPGIVKEIKWSSSAYKNQNFKFIDCEGIIPIDLLPIIQRDYKLDSYSLNNVAMHFLKHSKVDLPVIGIFKCFRIGISDNFEQSSKALGICGNYCIMDSVLVLELFNKLNVWLSLIPMAKTCMVPILTLFTQGQQIKVYSQIYKFCNDNDIVVETDAYKVSEEDRYAGAFVVDPKPGIYNNVIPLDFSSLYPSIIRAYNIDYSTLVNGELNVSDEECNILEWEDHYGCEHDPKYIRKLELSKLIEEYKEKKLYVRDLLKERAAIKFGKYILCSKRKYKFIKSDIYKGVLPTIIQSLIDERTKIRKTMNTFPKNSLQRVVLNQTQLAYKVSANSMYGITGVRKGVLPFTPLAMSITYIGRMSISDVIKLLVEKYKCKVIYGDTDSSYISLDYLSDPKQIWLQAVNLAKQISAEFPDPIQLEFEEAIYSQFLILTKKRYMYKISNENGEIKEEIGKKGVLLSRRDNSLYIRRVYEIVVNRIFESKTFEEILCELTDLFKQMYERSISFSDFTLTKSVNDYGNNLSEPTEYTEDKGKMGNYIVPLCKDDIQEKEKWYLNKLPGQVQLLEKIKKRGHIKDEGSRITYVVLKGSENLSKRMESWSYFQKYSSVLKIDYSYYIERLVNPLDQLFEAVFYKKDQVKNLFKYITITKANLINELDNLTMTKIKVKNQN
ncbi:DNA polymerase [Spirochaetia bacterium]|nr:DNA polymerase [Spirochaetia bacterium]